jgi:hypothetical protein
MSSNPGYPPKTQVTDDVFRSVTDASIVPAAPEPPVSVPTRSDALQLAVLAVDVVDVEDGLDVVVEPVGALVVDVRGTVVEVVVRGGFDVVDDVEIDEEQPAAAMPAKITADASGNARDLAELLDHDWKNQLIARTRSGGEIFWTDAVEKVTELADQFIGISLRFVLVAFVVVLLVDGEHDALGVHEVVSHEQRRSGAHGHGHGIRRA